jgi:uroporphyrinogen-III decarboxylase
MSPKARLFAALDGQQPPILPVAPLYMSLYLAGPRHDARARLWRERAEAAGGTRPVTREEYLEVEHAVWWEGYGRFAELPDWLHVPLLSPRHATEECVVEVDREGCFWRGRYGRQRLDAPFTNMAPCLWEADDPPASVDEVKARIPVSDADQLAASGGFDLAERLVSEMGERQALYWATGAPYPAAYRHLGFYGLMLAMRERPDIVLAIGERTLANTLAWAAAARNAGLELVFVEEWACGADLIGPADYHTFAWPFERDLCRGLRELGFRTVFYFCGSIADRLDRIAALEADALAFEESKKDWTVDIAAIRKELGPERCLFGNMDVVLLRDGSPDAVNREVQRQIESAGPGAFVVSLGSPVTLDTPPGQVDLLMRAARAGTPEPGANRRSDASPFGG